MNALLDLAARCEATEGPDRELDAEIARFFAEDFFGYVLDEPQPGCAKFTASLDAAMQLVPDGWSHGYSWNATHHNAQAHCEFIPTAPFAPAELLMCNSGKCTTPALALCAAALRARASGEQR